MKLQFCAFIAIMSFFILGCEKEATKGTVTGTVTYKNKPVTGGIVYFHVKTDQGVKTSAGQIDGEGNYKASLVPPGKAKVTVDTDHLKPPPGQKPVAVNKEGPPQIYMVIPNRYRNKEKSPLSADIKVGPQTHNFNLVDPK